MHGNDRDQELWNAFRLEVDALERKDPMEQARLAQRLGPLWGINVLAMRRILLVGFDAGELDAEVLACWDRQTSEQIAAEQPILALVKSVATEYPPSPRLQGEPRAAAGGEGYVALESPLPPRLQEYERVIRDCTREHGKAALQIGRSMILAQGYCQEHGCSFENFLARLYREYELHRATCFLYMKFVEWELPEGLRVSTMKWICQGFEPGSDLAKEVIQAASKERLNLAKLKACFGSRRKDQLIQEPGHSVATPIMADRARLLLKEKEHLLAQRAQIELRIQAVEAELQRLDLPN